MNNQSVNTISPKIKAISDRAEGLLKASPLANTRPVILGATKGQCPDAIEEAIRAGLRAFGENRVQEAEDKWPDIKKRHPQVRVHLIGPLQTNKAVTAVELFDAIQTVDREKLADALADAMQKAGRRPDCYVQINTGKEDQKAGAHPEDADTLIAYCKKLGLPLVGLMCVPPHDQPSAPHFALLRQIAIRHGLKELSMGMSEDFETAIRMGSTCVRIGRGIFGERS
jgi:PLP dependent protein